MRFILQKKEPESNIIWIILIIMIIFAILYKLLNYTIFNNLNKNKNRYLNKTIC